jgi:hypothetical protein
VSVEWLIFWALLIALDRHEFHALADDRRQFSIGELLDSSGVVGRCLDDLHGLAVEAGSPYAEGRHQAITCRTGART